MWGRKLPGGRCYCCAVKATVFLAIVVLLKPPYFYACRVPHASPVHLPQQRRKARRESWQVRCQTRCQERRQNLAKQANTLNAILRIKQQSDFLRKPGKFPISLGNQCCCLVLKIPIRVAACFPRFNSVVLLVSQDSVSTHTSHLRIRRAKCGAQNAAPPLLRTSPNNLSINNRRGLQPGKLLFAHKTPNTVAARLQQRSM